MGIGVSSHKQVRNAHCVTGGAGRSAMSAVMPSPAFHVGLWTLIAGCCRVGGPRWTAQTGCTGPRRGRTGASNDRPADRGPTRAQPVASGAGGRRAGVSVEDRMASTSAISAAISGSRCKISGSTAPMASLVVGSATVLGSVVMSHPSPRSPADQALMTWCPLLRPTAILRGLAFSATGIRSRRTPPS